MHQANTAAVHTSINMASHGTNMSHELMQQASEMLVNTSHVLHGLIPHKPPVVVLQSSGLPSASGLYKPSQMSKTVEIEDVTDTLHKRSQPAIAEEDALPFPAVTLPFEVP